MFIKEGNLKRIFVIRFEPGDDILEKLQSAVTSAGIQHGVILTGIGAVKSYGLHVVKDPVIPPGNIFWYEDNLAYDILSCSGLIMDGRIHAHVTIASRNRVLGGHLEPGMRVLNIAMITVGETEGLDLTDMDRYTIPDGAPLHR